MHCCDLVIFNTPRKVNVQAKVLVCLRETKKGHFVCVKLCSAPQIAKHKKKHKGAKKKGGRTLSGGDR
jgi:hypothetical protein